MTAVAKTHDTPEARAKARARARLTANTALTAVSKDTSV